MLVKTQLMKRDLEREKIGQETVMEAISVDSRGIEDKIDKSRKMIKIVDTHMKELHNDLGRALEHKALVASERDEAKRRAKTAKDERLRVELRKMQLYRTVTMINGQTDDLNYFQRLCQAMWWKWSSQEGVREEGRRRGGRERSTHLVVCVGVRFQVLCPTKRRRRKRGGNLYTRCVRLTRRQRPPPNPPKPRSSAPLFAVQRFKQRRFEHAHVHAHAHAHAQHWCFHFWPMADPKRRFKTEKVRAGKGKRLSTEEKRLGKKIEVDLERDGAANLSVDRRSMTQTIDDERRMIVGHRFMHDREEKKRKNKQKKEAAKGGAFKFLGGKLVQEKVTNEEDAGRGGGSDWSESDNGDYSD